MSCRLASACQIPPARYGDVVNGGGRGVGRDWGDNEKGLVTDLAGEVHGGGGEWRIALYVILEVLGGVFRHEHHYE